MSCKIPQNLPRTLADFFTLHPGTLATSPSVEKDRLLQELYAPYRACQACPLGSLGRTNIVFGEGKPDATLMFVGEGPGRDEDLQGRPFVGRSGKLLTKIIEAMGVQRSDVFIANVVKCRPPNNRTPTRTESMTCKNLLLFKQIAIIQPQVICLLGSAAARALLGEEVMISRIRGTFISIAGINIMPTYHPAYLLRNPSQKRTVWEDMQKIMHKLGLEK